LKNLVYSVPILFGYNISGEKLLIFFYKFYFSSVKNQVHNPFSNTTFTFVRSVAYCYFLLESNYSSSTQSGEGVEQPALSQKLYFEPTTILPSFNYSTV